MNAEVKLKYFCQYMYCKSTLHPQACDVTHNWTSQAFPAALQTVGNQKPEAGKAWDQGYYRHTDWPHLDWVEADVGSFPMQLPHPRG